MADLTPEQKTLVYNLFSQQVTSGAMTVVAANSILKDLNIPLIYNAGTVFFPKDGASKFLAFKRGDGKIQEINWFDGTIGTVYDTLELFQAAHPGFNFKDVNNGWDPTKPPPS